ncbi:sensor histidine kinase [Kineosporia succinea]|uniref:histidine kinase n=1 Tax=Kineosporia succinea TaxID=84632 RepID=A0ABT9PBA3_9ACTN|nr:histidine kinase [Kineosporia succinea]MDP9829974.1 signal transduction histidine kinase [Kineosporia succinea]
MNGPTPEPTPATPTTALAGRDARATTPSSSTLGPRGTGGRERTPPPPGPAPGAGPGPGPRSRSRARELVEPRHWVSGATESVAGLCQFVLLLRLGATLMLVAAAALIEPDPVPLLLGTLIAVTVTAAELVVLVRSPETVVRWPLFVVAELAAGAGIVAVMQGGPVFFSFSCGSAAVLGVAAGLRAWPVWVLQTVAAYVVVAWIIRLDEIDGVPTTLAVYLAGVPTLYVLVGLAAATARSAVVRHVNLARSALDSIERSAVAAERTRMARELHDSVEKTLRGLSFAAGSLPVAVQQIEQKPHLAADLAHTVATGARTAADEARELLGMLRADDLDTTLPEAVERACREWSARTGLPVETGLAHVDVDLPVRHEVLRILREALGNVAKHSGAQHAWVDLTREGRTLRLVVRDDGRGFGVPDDLTRLSADGHYGVVGMAERAGQIGGRLRVWSGAGDLGPVGGTQVVLWAPLSG